MSQMYGKLIVLTEESSMVGDTVTVRNLITNAVLSGTIGSNGYCEIFLPAFARYKASLNGIEETFEMGCGETHFLDLGFRTDTWAGIKKIIDAGKAADYINNGDRFEVELTTGETLIFEANVNTYGLGEVDFIPTYCMAVTKQHHTSNTNAGGWNSSDIRNYLNNTFLLTLPDDLQAVISAKPVKATIGGQSNTLQTAEDKIWIPTEKEVFGQITYSGSSENAVNNMYPIFTDAASRVRTQGANGAAVLVWLASPSISASTTFCIVYTSGAPDTHGAGASLGVLPCFRIAPAA